MLHLTFNNKLVASVNGRTVGVWLPGSKRQRKVNLPVNMLHRDSGTWHLLVPETFTGMLTDRSNRYAARFTATTLVDAFGRPERRIEPLTATPRTRIVRYASSEAQRRYYQSQARKLDELAMMVEGLNAACRIQRAGGCDLAKGLRDLNNRADWARGELRAAVIALNDAIDNNDTDLIVETREEIERREQALLECQRELDKIRIAARLAGITPPEQTNKEQHHEPDSKEHQYGNRSDGRHVLPNVRPDETTGTSEHDPDHGNRHDPAGSGEQGTRTADRGAAGREFDALIRESRASINESEALVSESDAQETTLRTQRDEQAARRNQTEGTRLRRKGRAL